MTNRHDAPGYITDVAYPAHFHREIMPVWLVCTLQALGRHTPDLRQPFTWLELGCGMGLSTLVAAACHPQGRFIGVDFSAREIDTARQLAQQAGLHNVEFVCESLSETAAHALGTGTPDCDFIVTHGVYSWISEADRQAIDRCIEQRLRPGGIAYVAYMSHPGSASFAAAQKLMRMASQHLPGDSASRARSSMNLLQHLARNGAGYFIEHPAIQREMERADQMDDAYMAHEFLNAEWHSLHVSDVMARFVAAGCEYAGSATLLDNIDAISIPAQMQPVLAQMQRQGADAAALETTRDIARNQNQRRDLYQKTAPHGNRLGPDAHRTALLAQQVMRLPAAPAADALSAPSELVLQTRIGPVAVPMPQLTPLLQALRQGPCHYADLARLPAYARNPGFISQLLQVLVWNGWLHFMPPPCPVASTNAQTLQAVLAHAGFGQWQLLPEAGTAIEKMEKMPGQNT